MTGTKGGGSDRAAGSDQTTAAKADKTARPTGAPATDDSPKRHGDKLEKARDAAAGKTGGTSR